MQVSKRALAGAVVVLGAGVAIAGGIPVESMDGRHTPVKTAYVAMRWAMAQPAIHASIMSRLANGNDLVDFGAAVHQPVAGGSEVHVYWNFNAAGGAPLGDIEALVFVDLAENPVSILELFDPTPVDDVTTPGANRQVNDEYEKMAVQASLDDPTVFAYADTRYGAAIEMWDEDCVFLKNLAGGWKKYRCTLVWKTAIGDIPPVGLRDIVTTVKVKNDLSSVVVLTVTSN